MFCPNCGKELVDNPKFCRNCGAKLNQDTVIGRDIESREKPDIDEDISAGTWKEIRSVKPTDIDYTLTKWVKPKPSSVSQKLGTILLYALAFYWMIILFIMIASMIMSFQQQGFSYYGFGNILWLILTLIAAHHADSKKRWGFVLGVTILLPIVTILGTVVTFAAGMADDFSYIEFFIVLVVQFLCIIFIAAAKKDFS